jgi:integrase
MNLSLNVSCPKRSAGEKSGGIAAHISRQARQEAQPRQFDPLVELIPEPYASMVYVAIYTGLRVSELAGLRWNDVGGSSITIW